MVNLLRGVTPRDELTATKDPAIGGLRRRIASVTRLPYLRKVVNAVGLQLDDSLRNSPQAFRAVQCLLGKDNICTRVRGADCPRCVLAGETDLMPRPKDYRGTIQGPGGACMALRPGPFGIWQRLNLDPDESVVGWLRNDAPCGILRQPMHIGIFVHTTGEVHDGPCTMTGYSGHEHSGSRSNDRVRAAKDELERHLRKGYVRRFAYSHAAAKCRGR